jgi:hypothetical protein
VQRRFDFADRFVACCSGCAEIRTTTLQIGHSSTLLLITYGK